MQLSCVELSCVETCSCVESCVRAEHAGCVESGAVMDETDGLRDTGEREKRLRVVSMRVTGRFPSL